MYNVYRSKPSLDRRLLSLMQCYVRNISKVRELKIANGIELNSFRQSVFSGAPGFKFMQGFLMSPLYCGNLRSQRSCTLNRCDENLFLKFTIYAPLPPLRL